MRSYNPVTKGHGGQIKKAIQTLMQAKRPMIYTGGGVILGDASEELAQLTRALGFPVHQHPDGIGGYPASTASSSACSACTAPTRPTWRCQHATAAGHRRALRRPRDRQPQAIFSTQNASSFTVDIDPSSISKRVKVDIPSSATCAKCCAN